MAFIELYGEIVFKLHVTTFNYYIQCNYMISKVQNELSLHVHVCTVQPLCVHIMCFSEPPLIPENTFPDEAFICYFLFRLPQDLSAQQASFGWI